MTALYFFGGDIHKDLDFSSVGASDLYYLNNCNDLFSAMVTLYAFMVGNNWNVIRDIYVIKEGRIALYFFNVYFLLCDMILMNILIGYIVDIYEEVHSK